MKQHCRTCKEIYNYCHSCAITKDLFKNAGYCDENCYHISLILQAHTVGVMASEDAAIKLREHNVENKQLRQALQDHWNLILQDIVVVEEVVPQEDVEVVIDENEDMTISENE